MAVKIFIYRKLNQAHEQKLTALLTKLRSLTLHQPGYISGETLRRIDRPGESVVISTWRSVEDWNSWVNSEKRNTIQEEIDRLLGEETEYAIYAS